LQKKLSEHLRTSAKKMDESKDIEKSVTDQEQRYYKFLAQVNELRDELKRLQQQHDKTAMEMKRRLDDKQGKAEEIKAAFVEFKREILKGAENSRTSKPIPPKLIAAFENQESEKDEEVERVRLSNINRRNFLRKLENTLRQKEKLADGLHLIDFEQLKIENQTLNEKIEERNEELLKLRKKTTTTVQVLTHLKEKLQFVQAENQVRKQELSDFEVELTAKRDVLTQVKHERDALRAENAGRRQAKGLVSSEELLIDYETRRRAVINKKEAMAKLQHQYESIVSQTADLRRAIASAGGVV
jgi:predicted  nucleic acid-binding Zn-ribbon protein